MSTPSTRGEFSSLMLFVIVFNLFRFTKMGNLQQKEVKHNDILFHRF